MDKVYKESLKGIGGAKHLKCGGLATVSPFASLMRGQRVRILGASLACAGRVCVEGEDGTLGHYTPSMLIAIAPRFEVCMCIGNEPENVWSDGDGTPETFPDRKAAKAALDEFLKDAREEYKAGNLSEPYTRADFIIRECAP